MAMVCLLMSGVSGCGVKGPPTAPGYTKPPIVRDLKYQVTENRLTLTWSIPSGTNSSKVVASANVYRLKQPLDNTPCPDCPKAFRMIKKIPARSNGMQFSDSLEKGFGYYYKIVLSDSGDRGGEDSNVVHYKYK